MSQGPGEAFLNGRGSTLGDAASSRHGTAEPGRTSILANTGTLVRKNGLLKRREWSGTCCVLCPCAAFCELLLPLGVVALVSWAHSACGDDTKCKLAVLEGWGGTMPPGDFSTECTEGLPLGGYGSSRCKAWSDDFRRPLPFVSMLGYLQWSGKRLAFAVDREADRPKVKALRNWISEHWHPDMQFNTIPCVDLEFDSFSHPEQPLRKCFVHGGSGTLPSLNKLSLPEVYNKTELASYLDSSDYGNHGGIFAAVVFDKVGGDGSLGAAGQWSYSIGLNSTTGNTVSTRSPKTKPLTLTGVDMGDARTYLDRGFVSIQLLLDRYIIGRRQEASVNNTVLLRANGIDDMSSETEAVLAQLALPMSFAPQSVETVPMPVAGRVFDGFYDLVSVLFPLCFIVAFLYTQKKILNELITEKESKVRESLRMMGVSSCAIIASWYISCAMIFGVLCAIFSLASSLHIFPSSDALIVFIFFWLWCMAFLSFAFFIHAFFNNSRTGGIVGMMLMFAQWIFYTSQHKDGMPDRGTELALMLLPNCAFVAGVGMLSKLEAAKVGATWSTMSWETDQSSMSEICCMLLVNIVLWTLVGWYLDRVLPKEYGVRLPWYFPCLPSYWAGMHPGIVEDELEEGLGVDIPAVCVGTDAVESVPDALRLRSRTAGTLVVVRQLRKDFKTPGGVKTAVANLELSMYEGQILALLGHNGAGKTTTVNMLTGMVAPTSGDALIAGMSLRTQLAEIRRHIGVCPQHDVLWMELTVIEHLSLFARLRGVPNAEIEVTAGEMMSQVGLAEKAKSRAGGLSGGQKRKLSLCLALLGKPPVCFLDEPTSGMDPFSRRSTWSILRGIRDGRVTVLTTHFMDEAEVLGDRIAIMAEGELQCCGSSLFLKSRFGAGYRITFARHLDPPSGASPAAAAAGHTGAIFEVVRRHIPKAELLTDVGTELSLRLPMQNVGRFSELFGELDAKKAELEVEHYGLSMVTLEEVFLRVASGDMAVLEVGKTSADEPVSYTVSNPVDERAASHVAAVAHAPDTGAAAQVGGGTSTTALHIVCLFMKRARYGRRDFKSVACTILLPVALLAFGLHLLHSAGNPFFPEVQLSVESQYGHRQVLFNATAKDWFSDTAEQADGIIPLSLGGMYEDGLLFGRTYKKGLPVEVPNSLHAADPSATLSMVMHGFHRGQGTTGKTVRYGDLLTSWQADVGDTATVIYNTSAVHAVPSFVNLLTSSLKRGQSGEGSGISVKSAPLPIIRSGFLSKALNMMVNFLSTFVIIIAFSWIPATIVSFIVREREEHHNSKHQQLISGVGVFSYWTANLLWDFCVYVVPLTLSVLCMWIAEVGVYLQNGAWRATVATLLGYGVCVIPFSYVISFAFKKHTSAQMVCLLFNFLTGLMLMITFYILDVIPATKPVNESLLRVYRIFPGFCLGHSLFAIFKNNLLPGILEQPHTDTNFLGMDVAGKDVTYLFVCGPLYFCITLFIDYFANSPYARFGRIFDPNVALEPLRHEDPDVTDEVARVERDEAGADDVRILKLRKVYRVPEGQPKVAVHGLTFGLKRGECFGFLGVNGAGKTTTMNMLTGAVLPSSGTATVAGNDIITEQWKVRRNLGYCPQHDALLDRLTVREHLELFGHIKQVPRAALRGYCDAMMRDLSLYPHVDKMAMTLSGGNKRKLSLAIALMGVPRLALLDEPSTGVDPAARRLMWNVISAVSTTNQHTLVVLTTHNMEEAEALCSRIGIMAGGRLRCIGSNQHLKARYGRGYQLEARVVPPTEEAVSESVRQWSITSAIQAPALPALCARLGCPGRLQQFAPVGGAVGDEEGRSVRESLAREGFVLGKLFTQWWMLEDRVKGVQAFVAEHFAGATLLERHDRKLRFHLPSVDSLAGVFDRFEAARHELCLEDYGISQTSLEQIFNGFAEAAACNNPLSAGSTGSDPEHAARVPISVELTGSFSAPPPVATEAPM